MPFLKKNSSNPKTKTIYLLSQLFKIVEKIVFLLESSISQNETWLKWREKRCVT